jgi:hypothetical protein
MAGDEPSRTVDMGEAGGWEVRPLLIDELSSLTGGLRHVKHVLDPSHPLLDVAGFEKPVAEDPRTKKSM